MRDANSCSLRADLNEIKRGVSVFFRRGDVIEVRVPKTRFGVVVGYFDDREKLISAVGAADARYQAAGVYYVINQLDPALLGRAYNRLKERAEHTTADNNILRRRWLPIDLDPVRPAGISSTDEEHGAAIARARIIARDMPANWGPAIISDSGNGAHLLYRIDFPNNPGSLKAVSEALNKLDRRYSDNVVKIDVACANAARIWKAYGTVARKGDSIPSRPHRLSRVIEAPNG